MLGRSLLWCGLVITAAAACDQTPIDVAVRASLDRGTQKIARSFKTRYTGSYGITLQFAWPISDQAVADTVNAAAAATGSAVVATAFDFTWQIRRGSEIVAQGSGRDGVTGVIDTSDSGLGGGRLKTRALRFGTFSARKGEQYVLDVSIGSGFENIFNGFPVLHVQREPPF